MIIKPANFVKGKINLPGDKSVSHRAAMFLAISEGEAEIENFATSEDCTSTLNCLRDLGVEIKRDGASVFIKGVGRKGLVSPAGELDCGNSGTTMRLLAGLLAGQPDFEAVLTGDESLRKRPMKRIIEPLKLMGAEIKSADGTAPLKIYGRNPLKAIEYNLPIASAQVKSCILMAGLNAGGETGVRSPKSDRRIPPSRNHTELMLAGLGGELLEDFIETDDSFIHRVGIRGNSVLRARNLRIPADISSAAFFLVAAACLPGSEILLPNVGLNPTRSAIIEVLELFGTRIEIFNRREINNEVIADLRVFGEEKLISTIEGNLLRGSIIANLIDEIPVLAVFGTRLEGGLEIRDAAELRAKESDRISAVVANLKRMNARVTEFPDGFRVEQSDLYGSEVDSFGDHRIAMAFAVAGLLAEGETRISNADCAGISFPAFFQVLQDIVK